MYICSMYYAHIQAARQAVQTVLEHIITRAAFSLPSKTSSFVETEQGASQCPTLLSHISYRSVFFFLRLRASRNIS